MWSQWSPSKLHPSINPLGRRPVWKPAIVPHSRGSRWRLTQRTTSCWSAGGYAACIANPARSLPRWDDVHARICRNYTSPSRLLVIAHISNLNEPGRMLEFVFRDLSSYSLKPISVISLYKIFKQCLMTCGLTHHKHKLEQLYVSTTFLITWCAFVIATWFCYTTLS